MKYQIKATKAEYEIDILGIPFGGPTSKDSDGEWFSPETKLHLDKFPTPPLVYFHGRHGKGEPSPSPVYVGKTTGYEIRPDGVWFRGVLDKAIAEARKVWEAAKEGMAAASSGSIAHLARVSPTGHITEWPVAELSVFDTANGRNPANRYAVVLPQLKAMYATGGISLPDDIDPTQEGDGAEAASKAADATPGEDTEQSTHQPSAKRQEGQRTMDPKDVQDLITQALKAQREAQDAERKAADDLAAVKAEAKAEAKAEFEAEAAKSNRLPGGTQAPYQMKYANLAKYDNLDVADHAALIEVLSAAKSKGHSQGGASLDAYRALAVKLGESKEDNLRGARMTAKMAGVPTDAAKANELNQSTLASYGDEWVFTSHSNQVWERITQEDQILSRLPAIEVPQGSESVTIPLAGTPPTFYVTAQAASQAANPGAITNTVITSKMGTGNQVLTVKKLSGADVYTGELEEDSIIPWLPELRRNMQQEAMEVMSHIVIDGDTATGATTNINDIGGTPAGTEAFLLLNGFRKLALVTNTANSRDGGAFTLPDFLETLKLMGLAGRNAMDKTKVGFIIDLWTHWKALELAQVATRDVFSAPTIEKGELINIYGHDVIHTANMHRANQDTTYGLKANSAGKLDLDTAANNTTGAILAVRWDQWRLGYKRRWTFETERHALADATVIVMSSRVGMVNRDTEASAITYNVTL